MIHINVEKHTYKKRRYNSALQCASSFFTTGAHHTSARCFSAYAERLPLPTLPVDLRLVHPPLHCMKRLLGWLLILYRICLVRLGNIHRLDTIANKSSHELLSTWLTGMLVEKSSARTLTSKWNDLAEIAMVACRMTPCFTLAVSATCK